MHGQIKKHNATRNLNKRASLRENTTSCWRFKTPLSDAAIGVFARKQVIKESNQSINVRSIWENINEARS